MAGGPLGVFGALLKVCVRDDGRASSVEALLAVTTLSFLTGLLSSGVTAYLLASAHLAV